MPKRISLVRELQNFVWQNEGKKINLPKPQCDEVIRLVLKFLNANCPTVDLLIDARIREATRKTKKGKRQ